MLAASWGGTAGRSRGTGHRTAVTAPDPRNSALNPAHPSLTGKLRPAPACDPGLPPRPGTRGNRGLGSAPRPPCLSTGAGFRAEGRGADGQARAPGPGESAAWPGRGGGDRDSGTGGRRRRLTSPERRGAPASARIARSSSAPPRRRRRPPPTRRRHDDAPPPGRRSVAAWLGPARPHSARHGTMEGIGRAALAEDAVRYRLFAAAAAGGEALLRRCAEAIVVRFAPLLAAYIWQRQPFRLRYVPPRGEPGGWGCEGELGGREAGACEGEPGGALSRLSSLCPRPGETPAHIGGTTLFGDNVEDEWFIVYLVREITREFPGLAAR